MADVFFDGEERAILLEHVAGQRGLSLAVVEKDLWICFALARLHTLQGVPHMTFKGGTSLSKVYGLIHRFSEDIDLTFDRKDLGFAADRDPLAEGLSGKRRRRLIKEISTEAKRTVEDVVVPGLRADFGRILGDSGWAVHVDSRDPDGQTATFDFPAIAPASPYFPQSVRLEFGARGAPWPTSTHVVKPYLEEDIPAVASMAVAKVDVLDAHRTFWEKATLLHALHHVSVEKPDKAVSRQSRHLYDLYQMWNQGGGLRSRIQTGRELLLAVVENKQVFFKDRKARYELVLGNTLNAHPPPELEKRLRADYEAMQDMLFHQPEPPTFEELLEAAREVDELVAGW